VNLTRTAAQEGAVTKEGITESVLKSRTPNCGGSIVPPSAKNLNLNLSPEEEQVDTPQIVQNQSLGINVLPPHNVREKAGAEKLNDRIQPWLPGRSALDVPDRPDVGMR
jgi:hypothetical protein